MTMSEEKNARVEEQLRRSHETFHHLIANNPFGVYIVDADLRMVQISAGAQKVFSNIRPLIGRDFGEIMRILWPEDFADQAVARFRHTLETGEPYVQPSMVERRQDIPAVEAYDWRIERITLPDGRFGVVCYFYDLSERQAWEEALRESEERFRNIADFSPVMIWVTEPEGRCIWLNKLWHDFTGQDREEALGFGWLEAVHPQDAGRTADIFRAANARQEPFRLDYRLRRRDGEYRWCIDSATPRFGAGGEYLGYVGSVLDITDRKEAEESLRQSEARWNAAIENFAEGVIIATEDEQVIYWNPAAREMHGFSRPDEFIEPLEKTPITFQLWTPDGRHLLELDEWPMRRIKRGQTVRNLELCIRRPDQGWEKVFSYSGTMVETTGGERLIFLTCHDLTDLRRAERAILKSEAKYRAVFEQAAIGIGRVSFADARWIDVNEAFCRMLGYTTEEMLATPWPEITHPEDLDLDLVPFRRMAAGELDSYSVEKRIIHKDGHQVWARLTLSLVRDAEGQPDYEVAVIEDVTERKRAEEELRRSEDRYRSLFEMMGEGFALGEPIFDEQGEPVDYRYLEVNAAYEQQTGLRREAVQGKPMREVVPELEQYWIDTFCGVALGGGEIRFENYNRATGRHYDVFCYSPGEGRFAILFRDITERMMAEEALRQLNDELESRVAERTAELTAANRELEAFAYTVSHDLRAPLRHIGGFAELLEKHLGPRADEPARRYLRTIVEAARRMGNQIDDLLMFSRLGRATINKRPVDLAALVEETRATLAPESHGRNIEWRIGPLPTIRGDANLLRTVLMNLLDNAMKYTRRRDPARIEVGCRQEEGETVCWVADNGVGFDMRYAGRIFGVFQRLHRAEEFEGTGIGLASVRRIIERHGGRVWAEGEVDRGATFYFSLPAGE